MLVLAFYGQILLNIELNLAAPAEEWCFEQFNFKTEQKNHALYKYKGRYFSDNI